ncbi:MAG: tetratricopeptide repeat protein [Nevskia sp.]|nr:tetratricopeptide repeat protein [Nevskia sp.]
MRPYLPLALSALLCACASLHGSSSGSTPPADAQAVQLKSGPVHTDLIRDMIANGQYYAALAHIEDERRNGGDTAELRLLEAEARRHLNQRAQAEALYRGLLAGPYAGPAYHGLGLLYVGTDLDTAIGDLRQAVRRMPTDVDFRNDLGYALMQAGRYTEAMPELSTAAELAPDSRKCRNNLIILMMLMGNEAAVQKLAAGAGATADELQRLRAEAQQIRRQQGGRIVAR